MPLFEYKCQECGEVRTILRGVDVRNAPAVCLKCGGQATRRFEKPGRFRRGSGWGARMDGAKMPGRIE